MKRLSPAICLTHIQKYSQYSQNEAWAQWYAHVAPLKAQRVTKVLLRYKGKNAKLLDLGCGTGMTFAALAQTFPKARALDIGNTEVKATKELLSILKTNASVGIYDGKNIPFADESFDVVTSIEVIEHVADPIRMLREIRRVLKKDGILHITTANKWWPIEPHFHLPFLSYLPAHIADTYVRLSGRGSSYEHIHLPSFREFKNMVERFFIVDDITFDVIKNYKHYSLDSERGNLIQIVGTCLSLIDNLKTYKITRPLGEITYSILSNISLGWLFIAHPKASL